MQSDSSKRAKESGVRDRRYSIRYPFAAEVEMLELKSGNRMSGVTSDLSLGGCFVCARRTLEAGARVRGTLKREGQKAEMLAVVRVIKPHVGMGLEFLDIDSDSQAILLLWIESLRKFPLTQPDERPHSIVQSSDYLIVTQSRKGIAICKLKIHD